MRASIILPILASALLLSFAASAQNTPFGNGTNSNQGSSDDDEDEQENPDKPQPYYMRKNWSVGASVETNRTLLQEDVGGSIKAYNTIGFFTGYNITRKDQIRLGWGLGQRFIADQTESGIRADDITLSYNHRFALPLQLMLVPSIGNSFPTSFNSQLTGMIAAPRASLFLMRGFLDNTLTVSLNGGSTYFITEYRQAVGREDANTRFSTRIGANVNYSIPFHQALQIGGSVGTGWSWSYDVDHANDTTLAEQFPNQSIAPSADQYVDRPLAQQSYSGEVYISYSLPSLEGINTNFQISLGQNAGVLREGATHLYWLSRRGGQASASLSISY